MPTPIRGDRKNAMPRYFDPNTPVSTNTQVSRGTQSESERNWPTPVRSRVAMEHQDSAGPSRTLGSRDRRESSRSFESQGSKRSYSARRPQDPTGPSRSSGSQDRRESFRSSGSQDRRGSFRSSGSQDWRGSSRSLVSQSSMESSSVWDPQDPTGAYRSSSESERNWPKPVRSRAAMEYQDPRGPSRSLGSQDWRGSSRSLESQSSMGSSSGWGPQDPTGPSRSMGSQDWRGSQRSLGYQGSTGSYGYTGSQRSSGNWEQRQIGQGTSFAHVRKFPGLTMREEFYSPNPQAANRSTRGNSNGFQSSFMYQGNDGTKYRASWTTENNETPQFGSVCNRIHYQDKRKALILYLFICRTTVIWIISIFPLISEDLQGIRRIQRPRSSRNPSKRQDMRC